MEALGALENASFIESCVGDCEEGEKAAAMERKLIELIQSDQWPAMPRSEVHKKLKEIAYS